MSDKTKTSESPQEKRKKAMFAKIDAADFKPKFKEVLKVIWEEVDTHYSKQLEERDATILEYEQFIFENFENGAEEGHPVDVFSAEETPFRQPVDT